MAIYCYPICHGEQPRQAENLPARARAGCGCARNRSGTGQRALTAAFHRTVIAPQRQARESKNEPLADLGDKFIQISRTGVAQDDDGDVGLDQVIQLRRDRALSFQAPPTPRNSLWASLKHP